MSDRDDLRRSLFGETAPDPARIRRAAEFASRTAEQREEQRRSDAARLEAVAAPFRVGRPTSMVGTLETSNRGRLAVS